MLSFQTDLFCENFEIAAVQKNASIVELEKCCQTHIFLQNFVLIQPRTSPLKICKNLQNLLILLTPANDHDVVGCVEARRRHEADLLGERSAKLRADGLDPTALDP